MSNINQAICQEISEWIIQSKSNREFALNHNIDEKIVRKILDSNQVYHIPVETLFRICEARNLPLSKFFNKIENEFGN